MIRFYKNSPLIVIIAVTLTCVLSSCDLRILAPIPEAEFDLSSDSRLPKWFTISSGYSREELTVKISYYAPPWGDDIKAVLIGPAPDFKELANKVGKSWQYPSEVSSRIGYPHYRIINIDGIDEIIEHKWKGHIVFIADAPALSQEERLTVLRSELSNKESELSHIKIIGDKFFALEALAELSFAAQQYDKSRLYANELLALAAKYPECCLSKNAEKTGKEILKQIETKKNR